MRTREREGREAPSGPVQEFSVRREDAGRALVHVLADALGLSRRGAKERLDERRVLVNRRRVWMARHAVRAGDRVEVLSSAPRPRPEAPAAVLYEDGDYLIADKPAGLLSNGPDSFEERLRARTGQPGLAAVHRLDRDTSGCLLFARSPAAGERILPLFRAGQIDKTYHAIVAGRLQPPRQTIALSIEGMRAVTHVQTLDANPAASHALLRIETGRTHQIRRHLAQLRHPVLGDRQYASRMPVSDEAMWARRQMLHAYGLSFRHPGTGATVRVTAPLPPDFRRCLRSMGLR